MFGLLETKCLKLTRIPDVDNYRKFSSKARTGKNGYGASGGITVFYRLEERFRTSKVYKSTKFDIMVIRQNVLKPKYYFFIYAPTADKIEETEAFYEELSQLYLKFKDMGDIHLLGDFNARLGKFSMDVNKRGVLTTNENESAFKGFLEFSG